MTSTLELKKELQTIQDLISKDFIGIVWLTDEELSPKLPYFYALDYLVDGGLSSIDKEKKSSEINLVMGKSFGHSFFVAHMPKDQAENKLTKILDIIPQNTTSPKVLILGNIGLNNEEALKKKAPHLTFVIHVP